MALIPEWEPRIAEMAKYSRGWKAIVDKWPELKSTMDGEVGFDWRKGRSAPRTTALMRELSEG